MQKENLRNISVNSLFLEIGKCCVIIFLKSADWKFDIDFSTFYVSKSRENIKSAVGMPNLLKIQLEHFEKDDNIAINCNYKQI